MNASTIALVAAAVAGVVAVWIAIRRFAPAGRRQTAVQSSEKTAPTGRLHDEIVDDEILEEETTGPGEAPRNRLGKLSLLGDLAAGIAHEINNPLSIMVEEAGWIEDLLEDGELQKSENLDELRRALKQIKTQGARCKEIIQNLLSFGRKTSIKVEEVQLNDLIRDVVKSYDKRLRSVAIEIRTRLDESLPACRISPSEMQQVLTNLINNALDALGSGGGFVEIATRVNGPEIEIDIADNGPGIPENLLDRIFDPFFTTKPVGKGTGLGLSICYGIVEKAGGEIGVESKIGAGTVFHIRLPWGKKEERAAKPAEPAAGEEESEAPAAGGDLAAVPTTVLVVGGERPFVEALARRLARRGFQALTAFGTEEALEKLRRKRDIDVVILDVKTPGMEGLEFLQEIKSARPLAEVILLSAHTTVESAIEGIKLGAFDYLLKPCDMAQLVGQIARAKRRKDRREQKIMEARIKEITSRRV